MGKWDRDDSMLAMVMGAGAGNESDLLRLEGKAMQPLPTLC